MWSASGTLVSTSPQPHIHFGDIKYTHQSDLGRLGAFSETLLLCPMIPAATQTLAEILAGGISLLSTEQIDFSHPGISQNLNPRLNLYCYNIQENVYIEQHTRQGIKPLPPPRWFDVSFLVSAWDFTSLGEQRLLSEALILLLHHDCLQEELLAPALRGHGELSMTVCAINPIDAAALWSALGVPLRPALYVTLTIPFNRQSDPLTHSDEEILLRHH
ncbi:Pvc16 family protein [Anabaena sp. UHCC 0399]|uniref:Pvc16 family protein n=1 Tax=Anabaena sp. UHCC 0399 TaxID=3110238 RepID=UPI002B1F8EC0|nr:Pvc16 family protein [Anabaena sp. UHCC 0399]MEA5566819.1 Pvc16 family protein [Anabaena sp. UHCC 0399]